MYDDGASEAPPGPEVFIQCKSDVTSFTLNTKSLKGFNQVKICFYTGNKL